MSLLLPPPPSPLHLSILSFSHFHSRSTRAFRYQDMSWLVASNETITGLLTVLDYGTPIILLFFFLSVFTLRSILTADNANILDSVSARVEYGPGGKPLPTTKSTPDKKVLASLDFSRSRKLLFNWLSLFTACTFIANAAVVLLRTLIQRKEGWWCGKAYTVCRSAL